ncbi:MAG: rhodanese-like domain-containing protein [Alphaproteobacteria bacterium]|nr:rhodanese-like domain-containing protein [Alphaproteobacteria bacterium]
MAMKKGIKQLLEEANARIKTVPVEEAIKMHGRDDVVFVDIRDVRELERDGMVAGAVHAPRGMLEFWVDPESPYFRANLNDESKQYLFYCASAWRSALATDRLTEMGMENVAHIEGGFTKWRESGGPVEKREKKG